MNRLIKVLIGAIWLTMTVGAGVALGSSINDDPGPRLQYGGTPIELHYTADGANFTKVDAGDGIVCVIVSDISSEDSKGLKIPVIDVDCGFPKER